MNFQSKFKALLVTRLLALTVMSALPQATLAQDGGRPPKPPEMTAAQKKCFTDNGLTAPGEGERPKTRPEKATMDKVDACLKENGLERPPHPHGGPGGDHRGPPPGPPPSEESSS